MNLNIKCNILHTTRELIDKDGFSNLSISRIAKEAKISKSHVYNYFDSKQDLLEQVIDEEIDQYTLLLADHFSLQ